MSRAKHWVVFLSLFCAAACKVQNTGDIKSLLGLEAGQDAELRKSGATIFLSLSDWFQRFKLMAGAKASTRGEVDVSSATAQLPAAYVKTLLVYLDVQDKRALAMLTALNNRDANQVKALLDLETMEMKDIALAIIHPKYKPVTADILAKLMTGTRARGSFVDRFAADGFLAPLLRTSSVPQLTADIERQRIAYREALINRYLGSTDGLETFRAQLEESRHTVASLKSALGAGAGLGLADLNTAVLKGPAAVLADFLVAGTAEGKAHTYGAGAPATGGAAGSGTAGGTAPSNQVFDPNKPQPTDNSVTKADNGKDVSSEDQWPAVKAQVESTTTDNGGVILTDNNTPSAPKSTTGGTTAGGDKTSGASTGTTGKSGGGGKGGGTGNGGTGNGGGGNGGGNGGGGGGDYPQGPFDDASMPSGESSQLTSAPAAPIPPVLAPVVDCAKYNLSPAALVECHRHAGFANLKLSAKPMPPAASGLQLAGGACPKNSADILYRKITAGSAEDGLGHIFNQGSVGSCSLQAAVGAAYILLLEEAGLDPKKIFPKDGEATNASFDSMQGGEATIEAAITTIQTMAKDKLTITAKDVSWDKALECICQGHPVLFGVPIDMDTWTSGGGGLEFGGGGKKKGGGGTGAKLLCNGSGESGHAIVGIGYDADGNILIKNSWGADWNSPMMGTGWMSKASCANAATTTAYCLTAEKVN